jgi:adenosylcobinamide-GDP ribazoletransferase
LFELADLNSAVGLLTRLPVPVDGDHATARGAQAAWAYPFVGILVALITALTAWMAITLGITPAIAAGIALFVQVVITGAMHEDGLSDAADGLWGGWSKERRLKIMKDSRIGAYGVIALVLSLLLRWVSLSLILTSGGFFWTLAAVAALSRCNMTVLMCFLPNARGNGLSQSVGRVAPMTAYLCIGFTALFSLFAVTSHVPVLFMLTAISALACAAIARRKIGGQTGDILGATQQVTEIVLLICLATVLT